eukprot:jgi/Hompol1/3147/HPOL_003135-RA
MFTNNPVISSVPFQEHDAEHRPIPAQERDQIKSHIVDLMISVPPNLQSLLSESVTIIADADFPSKWESLLPTLVSRLSLADMNVNIGVLTTAHSIFKRWRHKFRSNELFAEIKFVLNVFADPYLQFFKAIDQLVDQNIANKDALSKLLEVVLLLSKIFYSLNSQDLPEFFEDHQDEFMNLLSKYLVYTNPLMVTPSDEAGVVEKIKSMICESVDLYARVYDEDFKRLPEFVQIIWTLLSTTSNEPKNDVLVNRMLVFLSSVVKPANHKQMFSSPQTLQSICCDIILPNMRLRESDEERFEDDPLEYLRRDLEGSDNETRRSAAAELVRSLMLHFQVEVTQIFSTHITTYLQEYQSNPGANWHAKDTALFLITSLSAFGVSAQAGATQINDLIPVMQVFGTHVMPDLQAPVDGAVHPIIKVDALKFLVVFRSQLSKENLVQILPAVIVHLGSSNYVVNTWAAHTIERIFAIKTGNALMFSPIDVAPFASPIMSSLYQRITAGKTPEKLAENDYLMKCMMRTIATVRDQVPSVPEVLERLTTIIKEISKNPSNPKFNHYVFESVALLIRFVSVKNPAAVSHFEEFLTAPFHDILQRDVSEFSPYIFQIFSQMLVLHPNAGIPPSYQQLLMPLLTPHVWENQGNVPALVGLLQAYIIKGSADIVAHNQLAPFLGVCHKLLSSRINDHHGFDLLTTLFEHVPKQHMAGYAKNMFVVLLTRLSQSKTARFVHGFLNFMCFLFLSGGEGDKGMSVDELIAMLDSLQPQ